MTPDDLFEPVGGAPPTPGLSAREERANRDLLDALRRGSATGVPDLDVALPLTKQVAEDLEAFGTGGGQRLTDDEMALALRALRPTLARLGITFELPFRDYSSFRAYWIRTGGHGSWAARREMVEGFFEPVFTRLFALEDRALETGVADVALTAITDPGVIQEHLRRLDRNVDADPRLAVSAAKDLVESTAKLVLRERSVHYVDGDDLPTLVARAQATLGLHAAGVGDRTTEEARALRRILGSLANLTQGVAELRNQVGVGHGRESVPTWVRPRHARLAAGAATTWCNLMLETLADPEAPWRD